MLFGHEDKEDGGGGSGSDDDDGNSPPPGWPGAEDDEEERDEGPRLASIPANSGEAKFSFNPQLALGLRLSPGGWIDDVLSGGQAEALGVRPINGRVVRAESKRRWQHVASTAELKAALAAAKGLGDEEVWLVFSAQLPGLLKWCGGGVLQDGRLVAVPQNSRSALMVHPIGNGRAETFGLLPGADPVLGDVDDRWCGGVVTKSYTVIGVPYNASQFLEVDPNARTVVPRGETILMGKRKWRGGALCPKGTVVCFPCDAGCVLRIDPRRGGWSTFGDLAAVGEAKWSGGALSAYDDRLCVRDPSLCCLLIILPRMRASSPSSSSSFPPSPFLPQPASTAATPCPSRRTRCWPSTPSSRRRAYSSRGSCHASGCTASGAAASSPRTAASTVSRTCRPGAAARALFISTGKVTPCLHVS